MESNLSDDQIYIYILQALLLNIPLTDTVPSGFRVFDIVVMIV